MASVLTVTAINKLRLRPPILGLKVAKISLCWIKGELCRE